MSATVLEHYPVEKLPADLRERVPGAESVRLTLEPDLPQSRRTFSEIRGEIDRLRKEGAISPATPEDAVARIRALRDEWKT